MDAGNYGESEDCHVNGWQVISAYPGRNACCDQNQDDRQNLNRCVYLPQPRRAKTTEAGNDIDRGGAYYYKDVAADYSRSYPERYRQMAGSVL